VPSDALLEYRFLVDGKPQLDGRNPNVTPNFEFRDRNFLTMPNFVASAHTKARYGIDKGTTSRLVFKTNTAPFTDHLVWVYTPYGYTKDKSYSVLFVYDGQWSLEDRF
jgi:enterochelin esterase-like enzyme